MISANSSVGIRVCHRHGGGWQRQHRAERRRCAVCPKRCTPFSLLFVETSTVEDLINANLDGYRQAAYVVRWQGSRIIIPGGSVSTEHAEGAADLFFCSCDGARRQ